MRYPTTSHKGQLPSGSGRETPRERSNNVPHQLGMTIRESWTRPLRREASVSVSEGKYRNLYLGSQGRSECGQTRQVVARARLLQYRKKRNNYLSNPKVKKPLCEQQRPTVCARTRGLRAWGQPECQWEVLLIQVYQLPNWQIQPCIKIHDIEGIQKWERESRTRKV